MSKRRKIGDRVWVINGAAFGKSQGQWATIIDWLSNLEESLFPCPLNCGDIDCKEWNDLETDDNRSLYHVSECEMFDSQNIEPCHNSV